MLPDSLSPQRTALVVDDDELVLAVTVALLQDLGFEAIAESSPEQALSRVRKEEGFDLLLTDWVMPGVTGVELIKVARQERPELSVILASGYQFDREQIGDRVVFLQKPYGKLDLIRAIGDSMVQAMGQCAP